MTEQTTPETRLWTPTGFREDDWNHAESADAVAEGIEVAGDKVLPQAQDGGQGKPGRELNRMRPVRRPRPMLGEVKH